jgi:hypothetical protein
MGSCCAIDIDVAPILGENETEWKVEAPLVAKYDGVALATSWLRCNVTAVPSDTAER